MDLQRLKIFCEVYRQRGYSQAARRIKLTQSAVSQQVRTLERELGVPLFDKASRTTPTAAGDYLYNEGSLILASIDDVARGVRNAAGLGQGSVRFGMIDVAAIGLMPNVLAAFRREHPHVKVEAVVRTSGELVEMVLAHELDFGIAVINQLPDGVKARELYRDSIVAVLPRGRQRGRQLSVKDLKGEPLIVYPLSSHTRRVIDEAFRDHGIVPTVNMEMHYPAAICSLVQQGMGIGLISAFSAREHRLRGQQVLPIAELKGAQRIGIVTHSRRQLPPQAAALVSMALRTGLKKHATFFSILR
ncbi:MAG: LysR family transcriptional regulator [bacterium]